MTGNMDDRRVNSLADTVHAARKQVGWAMTCLLVLVVLGPILFFTAQHRADVRARERAVMVEHQLAVQCILVRDGNQRFNETLDVLLANAMASQALTPAEKAQRQAQYAPLHLPIGNCPPATR